MRLTINCYSGNLENILKILACDLEMETILVFVHTVTGHPNKLFTVYEYTLEIPDFDRSDEDLSNPYLSESEYKTDMHRIIVKRFKRFKNVGIYLE